LSSSGVISSITPWMRGYAAGNAVFTWLRPPGPCCQAGEKVEFNKIKGHEIVDLIELTEIDDLPS
jgi:hypothetical protein